MWEFIDVTHQNTYVKNNKKHDIWRNNNKQFNKTIKEIWTEATDWEKAREAIQN